MLLGPIAAATLLPVLTAVFALIGPFGLGTQISAVVAVAVGSSATRSFLWVAGGTVLWCTIAGIAASFGIDLFGG